MDQFCFFSKKYFVNFIKNIIKPRDIIEMADLLSKKLQSEIASPTASERREKLKKKLI